MSLRKRGSKAHWKTRTHESIKPSWAGVASLLASSRMLSQEFSAEALPEVFKLVRSVNVGNCQVTDCEFDFATMLDTLYKLLMPKLPLELATDLRQWGSTNGFELYRRVVRKIDPPKENDPFHMGIEIQGLGGKGLEFPGVSGAETQALRLGNWRRLSLGRLGPSAGLRGGRGHHGAP